MTFDEWLKKQCKMREERINGGCSYKERLFEPLICADGTWLSIQASKYHSSTPEEDLSDGNYESVEIYCSDDIKELEPFANDGYIYPRIYVEIVEVIIQKHGGIDEVKCKEALNKVKDRERKGE